MVLAGQLPCSAVNLKKDDSCDWSTGKNRIEIIKRLSGRQKRIGP
jgi:hypothetical protein